MKKGIQSVLLVAASLVLLASCSINRFATRMVANALTQGTSNTFTSDDDPALIGDAMPFALKMYQALLEQQPDHRGLIVTTGSGFISYANAFVQTPAMMLPPDQFQQAQHMKARARKLYLRGRDILLNGADRLHPGFLKAIKENDPDPILAQMTRVDVPLLYWTAAGWLGAYSLDTMDFKLGLSVPTAEKLMARARELEPDFNEGAIHEFYILYYGSMPAGLGGDLEKAREEFNAAVRVSGGRLASPYVSLATTVAVSTQDYPEFRALLQDALAVNPDAMPDYRLLNIIAQQKARWYLDHADQFFVTLDSGGDNGNSDTGSSSE